MERRTVLDNHNDHSRLLGADERAALIDDAMDERFRALTARHDRYRDALQWIADRPTDPRPDGTFNYSREAIIAIARDAMEDQHPRSRS